MFIASLAWGAVKPGQNLVYNGCFQEVDADGNPVYWLRRGVSSEEFVQYFPDGGPDNLPFVRISNPDGGPTPGEATYRQYGLTLKEGETYKFSALVRTRNFRSRNYGFGVINFDWYQNLNVDTLPENQDWTRVEKTVTMIPSKSNTYVALIFVIDGQGSLDVTDFRIEAVSEGALANSEMSAIVLNQLKPRLVAVSPRLCQIPQDDPAITFRFYGDLPEGTSRPDYDIVLETSGFQPSIHELSGDTVRMNLPEGAKKGDLYVNLVNRATGEKIYSSRVYFDVVVPPEIKTEGYRRLNNCVTEILNAEIAPELSEHEFYAPRNGWIFAAVEGSSPSELKVVMDDSLEVISSAAPRLETFRKVAAGRHTLKISQADSGSRIIVRSVPDIFSYIPCQNSMVPENPPYDWEFHKRYALPAVTTFDGGNIPDEHIAEFHSWGYKWVGNLNSRALSSNTDLASRLERSEFITSSNYDGVACDEQVMNEQDIIERYAAGLYAFRNPENKILYSWNGDIPSTPVDASFVSSCINASHGEGMMIQEVYAHTMASREEAEQEARANMTKLIDGYRNFFPGCESSLGIILGVFMQVPIISIHSHPEADFKAHLDLQCQILATDPAFDNISCVGGWGTYYADEENHRWFYRLMRHYFVEGRTDSLAEEYGFPYIPAHLDNGCFADGFADWTVDGAVTVEKFPGFGFANLGVLVREAALDNAAVFHKNGGNTSAVSQVLKNLEPGRRYCLQFVTMDADDVRTRKHNPRIYGITARLPEELELIPELSWLHNDQREKGRYTANSGVARINLHHIVFEAKASEATIVFDNAGALDGENLGLTYISLNPYFSAE